MFICTRGKLKLILFFFKAYKSQSNLLFQTRYLKLIPRFKELKVSDVFNSHLKAKGIAADYLNLAKQSAHTQLKKR